MQLSDESFEKSFNKGLCFIEDTIDYYLVYRRHDKLLFYVIKDMINYYVAQSVWAVQYSDCISAEG